MVVTLKVEEASPRCVCPLSLSKSSLAHALLCRGFQNSSFSGIATPKLKFMHDERVCLQLPSPLQLSGLTESNAQRDNRRSQWCLAPIGLFRMSDEGPRNRRERRAAAKGSGKPLLPPSSQPKFRMAQPDRSKPKGATLLDLYEEKKSLLDHGQPFDPVYQDGQVRDEGGNILEAGLGDGEPIGPAGNAFFWSVCLTMLHFTLDVLVYNQYRQDIEWKEIVQRTFTVLPVLFVLVYMMRSQFASRFATAKQILFLTFAVGTGCYTIHVTNRYDYFAVMKQAPPLGTLWVWSVIEMDLWFAAASIVVDVGYLWWKGYSIA